MNWYGAHVIMYLKYLDGTQEQYDVREDIFLIGTDNLEQGFAEAKRLGKNQEADTTVGVARTPARWIFAGVSKLIKVLYRDAPFEGLPQQGTEITYIRLVVENEQDLKRLADGREVVLVLEGPIDDEELDNQKE